MSKRISNGWAEQAKKYLEKEREESSRRIREYFERRNKFTGCDCECHQICHTCGSPFVGGRPHINCGDMVGGGVSITYGGSSAFAD